MFEKDTIVIFESASHHTVNYKCMVHVQGFYRRQETTPEPIFDDEIDSILNTTFFPQTVPLHTPKHTTDRKDNTDNHNNKDPPEATLTIREHNIRIVKAMNSVRAQYTRRFQRSTAREQFHETRNEHEATPSEPIALRTRKRKAHQHEHVSVTTRSKQTQTPKQARR